MRLYEVMSGEELTVAELILRRRLQMLVHSRLYYELNTNIISDRQFDMWAKELVQLQRDNPDISKQVEWYDAFKDWDGTTGAFLPLKDPWVIKTANRFVTVGGRANGKTHLIDTFVKDTTKSAVKSKPSNGKLKLF